MLHENLSQSAAKFKLTWVAEFLDKLVQFSALPWIFLQLGLNFLQKLSHDAVIGDCTSELLTLRRNYGPCGAAKTMWFVELPRIWLIPWTYRLHRRG